jgi:hypothetical protein
MATQQELERQLQTVGAALSDINVSTAAPDLFFERTGEQKLEKAQTKTFSEIYTPEYEKIKDIQFSVQRGADNQAAFYVFDPAKEAERRTTSQLKTIEEQNKAFESQQTRLQSFIEERQSLVSQSAFDLYLTDTLKNLRQSQLTQGVITSDSPLFDQKKFNAAKDRKRITIGRKGTDNYKVILLYTDKDAAAAQLTSYKTVYDTKFKADAALQKKYIGQYKKDLETQQKNLKAQLDKLLKGKK